MTIAGLLDRELRRNGARPFLTWYDDADGSRVELSIATTANWAAKIANFLVDDHGVEPGDPVGIDPRLHWITAVVLLGAWTAGAQVELTTPPLVEVAYDAMGVELSRLVAAQPDQLVMPVVVSAEAALELGGRTWSHAALTHAAQQAAAHHRLDPTSRVLTTVPFDTTLGLDAGLLMPLAAGGSVVLISNPDQDRMLDRLDGEHVTHVVSGDRLAPVDPAR